MRMPLRLFVECELKKAGLSRSDLAVKLGYHSINRGLRRVDGFLDTLNAPYPTFPTRLMESIGSDESTFQDAIEATEGMLAEQARSKFRPSIFINIQERPRIVVLSWIFCRKTSTSLY